MSKTTVKVCDVKMQTKNQHLMLKLTLIDKFIYLISEITPQIQIGFPFVGMGQCYK